MSKCNLIVQRKSKITGIMVDSGDVIDLLCVSGSAVAHLAIPRDRRRVHRINNPSESQERDPPLNTEERTRS